MALLAQFLGEDTVAKMSPIEIERTCDILHAEMLKAALSNATLRKDLTSTAARVAITTVRGGRLTAFEQQRAEVSADQLKELQDVLKR